MAVDQVAVVRQLLAFMRVSLKEPELQLEDTIDGQHFIKLLLQIDQSYFKDTDISPPPAASNQPAVPQHGWVLNAARLKRIYLRLLGHFSFALQLDPSRLPVPDCNMIARRSVGWEINWLRLVALLFYALCEAQAKARDHFVNDPILKEWLGTISERLQAGSGSAINLVDPFRTSSAARGNETEVSRKTQEGMPGTDKAFGEASFADSTFLSTEDSSPLKALRGENVTFTSEPAVSRSVPLKPLEAEAMKGPNRPRSVSSFSHTGLLYPSIEDLSFHQQQADNGSELQRRKQAESDLARLDLERHISSLKDELARAHASAPPSDMSNIEEIAVLEIELDGTRAKLHQEAERAQQLQRLLNEQAERMEALDYENVELKQELVYKDQALARYEEEIGLAGGLADTPAASLLQEEEQIKAQVREENVLALERMVESLDERLSLAQQQAKESEARASELHKQLEAALEESNKSGLVSMLELELVLKREALSNLENQATTAQEDFSQELLAKSDKIASLEEALAQERSEQGMSQQVAELEEALKYERTMREAAELRYTSLEDLEAQLQLEQSRLQDAQTLADVFRKDSEDKAALLNKAEKEAEEKNALIEQLRESVESKKAAIAQLRKELEQKTFLFEQAGLEAEDKASFFEQAWKDSEEKILSLEQDLEEAGEKTYELKKDLEEKSYLLERAEEKIVHLEHAKKEAEATVKQQKSSSKAEEELHKKLSQSQAILGQTKEKLRTANADLEKSAELKHQLEKSRAELQVQLEEKTSQLEEKTLEFEKTRSEMEGLSERLSESAPELKAKDLEVRDLSSQLELSTSKHDTAKAQLEALTANFEGTKRDAEDTLLLQLAQSNEACLNLKDEIELRSRHVARLEAELESQKVECADLKKQVESLQVRENKLAVEHMAALSKLQLDLDAKSAEMEPPNAGLAYEATANKIDAITAAVLMEKERTLGLQKDNTELSFELGKLRSELQSVRSENTKLHSQIANLQEALSIKEQSLSKLLADSTSSLALSEQLSQRDDQIYKLESELALLQQSREALERLEALLHEKEDKITQLEHEVAELRDNLVVLHDHKVFLETELEHKLGQEAEKNKALQVDLEEVKNKQETVVADLQAKLAENSKHVQVLVSLQESIDSFCSSLEAERLERLEKSIPSKLESIAETFNSLGSTTAAHILHLNELQERIDAAHVSLEADRLVPLEQNFVHTESLMEEIQVALLQIQETKEKKSTKQKAVAAASEEQKMILAAWHDLGLKIMKIKALEN